MFRFSSLLFVSLLLAPSLAAQESLTLTEAIKIGLEKNFSIQIENQRVEIAKNNNNIGEAGMLPDVSFSIAQNFSLTELDNPAGFLSAGSITGRTFNPAAAVNWTVFNGLNVRMNLERLRYLEEQSLGNAQIIIENTIQSIILAYYTALLEEERLDVFERTLRLSRDRYNYVKMKGEMGSAVTFDILQDKTAYLTDSSNYLTQVLNYRNALRNLNLLLSVDVEKRYELTDKLEIVPQEFNFDELYALMASNNNNLKNQFINQEILKRDVKIAKSALFPRIDLGINANQSRQLQDLSSAVFAGGDFTITEPVTSSTLNYTAGLTLSYTLFNGGRIKRQLENARITEQIGLLEVNELKLSLKNNLVNNFDNYNLKKVLLDITSETVEASDLSLELATDRYQSGVINSFNYRDIQINFINNSLNNLQAIYNLIETEVELMRLTGKITHQWD